MNNRKFYKLENARAKLFPNHDGQVLANLCRWVVEFIAPRSSHRRPSAADLHRVSDDQPTPGVAPGNGLQPPETATTVRVQDGKAITTDGPLVDTKEALNGHFVYEAGGLDGAFELAADPGSPSGRNDRGPAHHGVVAVLGQTFRASSCPTSAGPPTVVHSSLSTTVASDASSNGGWWSSGR